MDNRVWRRANNPELSRHTWDTSIPTLVAPSHYFFYIDGQEAVQENWYNWQKRQQKTTTKRQRQGRWQGQWNNKRRLTLIDDSYSGALVFCFLYISDNRESQMMTWQSGVTLDSICTACDIWERAQTKFSGMVSTLCLTVFSVYSANRDIWCSILCSSDKTLLDNFSKKKCYFGLCPKLWVGEVGIGMG